MKHPSPLAVRWRRLLTGALAGSLVLTPMLSGVAHAAEIAPAETAAEYVLDAPLEADGYTAPAPLADEYPIGEYAAPEFDYLTIYTDSAAQHQDAVEYEVAQLASRSLTSNQIVNGWSWGGSNITLGARPWIEARSAHFNHTWPEGTSFEAVWQTGGEEFDRAQTFTPRVDSNRVVTAEYLGRTINVVLTVTLPTGESGQVRPSAQTVVSPPVVSGIGNPPASNFAVGFRPFVTVHSNLFTTASAWPAGTIFEAVWRINGEIVDTAQSATPRIYSNRVLTIADVGSTINVAVSAELPDGRRGSAGPFTGHVVQAAAPLLNGTTTPGAASFIPGFRPWVQGNSNVFTASNWPTGAVFEATWWIDGEIVDIAQSATPRVYSNRLLTLADAGRTLAHGITVSLPDGRTGSQTPSNHLVTGPMAMTVESGAESPNIGDLATGAAPAGWTLPATHQATVTGWVLVCPGAQQRAVNQATYEILATDAGCTIRATGTISPIQNANQFNTISFNTPNLLIVDPANLLQLTLSGNAVIRNNPVAVVSSSLHNSANPWPIGTTFDVVWTVDGEYFVSARSTWASNWGGSPIITGQRIIPAALGGQNLDITVTVTLPGGEPHIRTNSHFVTPLTPGELLLYPIILPTRITTGDRIHLPEMAAGIPINWDIDSASQLTTAKVGEYLTTFINEGTDCRSWSGCSLWINASIEYQGRTYSRWFDTITVLSPDRVIPSTSPSSDPQMYNATTGVLVVNSPWEGRMRTVHSLPGSTANGLSITWVIDDAGDTGAEIDEWRQVSFERLGTITMSAWADGNLLETFTFEQFMWDLYIAMQWFDDGRPDQFHPLPLPTHAGNIPLTWIDQWGNFGEAGATVTELNRSGSIRLTVQSDTMNNDSNWVWVIAMSQSFYLDQIPTSVTAGVLAPLPATTILGWTPITWRVTDAGDTGAFITEDGYLGAQAEGYFTIRAYPQTGRGIGIPFRVFATAAEVVEPEFTTPEHPIATLPEGFVPPALDTDLIAPPIGTVPPTTTFPETPIGTLSEGFEPPALDTDLIVPPIGTVPPTTTFPETPIGTLPEGFVPPAVDSDPVTPQPEVVAPVIPPVLITAPPAIEYVELEWTPELVAVPELETLAELELTEAELVESIIEILAEAELLSDFEAGDLVFITYEETIFVAPDAAQLAAIAEIVDIIEVVAAAPGTAQSIWMEMGTPVEITISDDEGETTATVFTWTDTWVYLPGDTVAVRVATGINPFTRVTQFEYRLFTAQRVIRGGAAPVEGAEGWLLVGTNTEGITWEPELPAYTPEDDYESTPALPEPEDEVAPQPTPELNPEPTPELDEPGQCELENVVNYAEWNAKTVFNTGNRVVHNGRVFEAQWWTQGDVPGTQQWGSWMEIAMALAADCEPVTRWTADRVFNTGDRVYHNGDIFEAQWWVRGEEPGTNQWGSWMQIATTPDDASTPAFDIWTGDRVFTGGETIYYNGNLWYAQWWTRGDRPGASQWGPWRHVSVA